MLYKNIKLISYQVFQKLIMNHERMKPISIQVMLEEWKLTKKVQALSVDKPSVNSIRYNGV